MEIQTDNPREGYPFPCFSFDERDSIALNTAYIMCSDSVDVRYILVVLNSSVGRVIAKLYVTQLQEKQFRMLAQYLTKFPIVRTANNTLRKIADLVQMLLIDDSEYYECEINKVIYEQYGFDIHEIAYIEGLQFNM